MRLSNPNSSALWIFCFKWSNILIIESMLMFNTFSLNLLIKCALSFAFPWWFKGSNLRDVQKLIKPLSVIFVRGHSAIKWQISFRNCLGWNTAQIHCFCIPLDLLDIKDLNKIKKGQWRSWRPNQRPQGKNSKMLWFFSLSEIIWSVSIGK